VDSDPDIDQDVADAVAEVIATMRAMLVLPPHLTSTNTHLVKRTADLNVDSASNPLVRISRSGPGVRTHLTAPVAHYVDNDDIRVPPAPAWYLPGTNDLYIHVDAAGLTGSIPAVDVTRPWNVKGKEAATILGLLCHEAGHAAISGDMIEVQKEAPHHADLLTLIEEIRVENQALRAYPEGRAGLRASMAIVLKNLPDEFETKGHVVRAWTICHGRTLAGISDEAETSQIDVAARTLLTDDVVDALTDLLQEAITLKLNYEIHRNRLIKICDEWTELVGEPAETTGCATCAREAQPGEKTDNVGGGGKSDEEGDDDEAGDGGGADGDGEDGEPTTAGEKNGAHDHSEPDRTDAGTWGTPGQDSLIGDNEDIDYPNRLTDEDAELMSMLTRNLSDLMQDEWMRERDHTIELANSREWAAKIFGNTTTSRMLSLYDPKPVTRQSVVRVAGALSALMLPAISKTAKAMVIPPGKLRGREAVRQSAERAQGRMTTAKPWAGTVRRHSSARPLIVGVATDTSGSMGWAQLAVAEFAFVFANAGHRVGARTAAVTFGDRVVRIARPGEVMAQVAEKPAHDGSEEFDKAMAALDGVLHLTEPSYSARILFIVSDGAFVIEGESDRAAEWVRRMDKVGTHIVWVTDVGGPHWLAGMKLDRVSVRTLGKRGREVARVHGERHVYSMMEEEALLAIAHDIR
jgi:hypothetical protein